MNNLRRFCTSSPIHFFGIVGLLLFMTNSASAQRIETGKQSLANQGAVQLTQAQSGQQNQQRPQTGQAPELQLPEMLDVERMLSPDGLTSTLKIMLILTVLSLAPSILIMTTCFIRFVIVLGLLRQAIGTQQLPPNQVVVSLCLFLTFMIMAPVWEEAYEQGIQPYSNPQPGQPAMGLEEAFHKTVRPIREFMGNQIEGAENTEIVFMFLEFQAPEDSASQNIDPSEYYYDDVPLSVLLPSYMLSELKTAFIIGFQLYLPFVIIDMVIASVLISMGMMMLPPVLISLPFKLLLFVLIDGWALTVGMMLESVSQFY
jgi:flagellar biosynthetic protein FliP